MSDDSDFAPGESPQTTSPNTPSLVASFTVTKPCEYYDILVRHSARDHSANHFHTEEPNGYGYLVKGHVQKLQVELYPRQEYVSIDEVDCTLSLVRWADGTPVKGIIPRSIQKKTHSGKAKLKESELKGFQQESVIVRGPGSFVVFDHVQIQESSGWVSSKSGAPPDPNTASGKRGFFQFKLQITARVSRASPDGGRTARMAPIDAPHEARSCEALSLPIRVRARASDVKNPNGSPPLGPALTSPASDIIPLSLPSTPISFPPKISTRSSIKRGNSPPMPPPPSRFPPTHADVSGTHELTNEVNSVPWTPVLAPITSQPADHIGNLNTVLPPLSEFDNSAQQNAAQQAMSTLLSLPSVVGLNTKNARSNFDDGMTQEKYSRLIEDNSSYIRSLQERVQWLEQVKTIYERTVGHLGVNLPPEPQMHPLAAASGSNNQDFPPMILKKEVDMNMFFHESTTTPSPLEGNSFGQQTGIGKLDLAQILAASPSPLPSLSGTFSSVATAEILPAKRALSDSDQKESQRPAKRTSPPPPPIILPAQNRPVMTLQGVAPAGESKVQLTLTTTTTTQGQDSGTSPGPIIPTLPPPLSFISPFPATRPEWDEIQSATCLGQLDPKAQ